MHFIVECLPLCAGPFLLLFLRLTSPSRAKKLMAMLIPLIFAIAANALNNEGPGLFCVDLVQGIGSCGFFLLLSRSVKKWGV